MREAEGYREVLLAIREAYTPDTHLTAWVMAPIYIAAHGIIFAVIEVIKHCAVKKDLIQK
jgi:hypothetical protein